MEKIDFQNKVEEGLKAIKENTLVDCFMIEYCEKNVSIACSKFGGTPYFPRGATYPVNEDGYPLCFFAQINFSDFDNHELLPNEGLLQFFVDGTDELFGVNLVDAQNARNFRVVYYEKINPELQTDLPHFEQFEGFDFIELVDDQAMKFHKTKQHMSLEDYRFFTTFKNFTNLSLHVVDQHIEDLYERYLTDFSFYSNQVLGYPVFLQADTRMESDKLDVMLFQAVASEHLHFAWGECGVFNFFISQEDLLKRDFSRVSFQFDVC